MRHHDQDSLAISRITLGCRICGLFQDSESGRPGLHSVEEIGDAVCDVVADQTTMPDGSGILVGYTPRKVA